MSKPTQESLEKVNRFEVIDHTANGLGRAFVKWEEKLTITFDFQDDGRTLKVFIDDYLGALPPNEEEKTK